MEPDLVILDASLPDMKGLELFNRMGEIGRDIAAVMTTDNDAESAEVTVHGLEQGVLDFISKPAISDVEVKFERLCDDLRRILEVFRKHHLLEATGPVADVVRPETAAPLVQPAPPTATVTSVHARIDVVAIGISTGGPKALTQLLPMLPPTLRVPVVVVQHMPKTFTMTLTESLAAQSRIRVVEGRGGQQVEPGVVYFAPGGQQMKVVTDGTRQRLAVTDDPPENRCKPAVDYLFRSVAEAYGNRSLGIIMTGMGADGREGLILMKERGARVIAQDEESSLVFGMPQEAIKAGVVDEIVGLEHMADTIVRHVGND